MIPAEIKSFTETPCYNLKGLRQAIENKVCAYDSHLQDDLSYASFVVGFNHPSLGEIFRLISLGFEAYPDKPFYFPINIPW